jgi:hypothetical protein
MRARKNRKGQKTKGNQSAQLDSWAPSAERVPQLMRTLTKEARIFRKVLANVGVIATAASGYLGVTPVAGSNAVTSCGTWTAMSQNALEYRVIGMEVQYFPVTNTATSYATPTPAMIVTGLYSSGVTPTTVDEIAQAPGATIVNGFRPFRQKASAKGFPDAMLWTATNATIASANTYGFVISDQAIVPAGPVMQNILRFCVRYIVEFRSLD